MAKPRRVSEITNVTIFGAGVTGLTVAHELVERGFRVQVWEPQGDDRYPFRGCDVGGLARTQWSRVHWPEIQDLSGEVVPRVGKRPFELRMTSKQKLIVSAPKALGLRTVANVLERLNRDSADVQEPFVDVFVRTAQESTDLERNPVFRVFVQAVLAKWPNARPGNDAISVELPKGRKLTFRCFYREERKHRGDFFADIKADVVGRLEFYYRPEWGVPTEPIHHLPQKFYQLAKNKMSVLGAAGASTFDDVAHEVRQVLEDNHGIEQIYIEVYSRRAANNAADTVSKSRDYGDLDFALKVISAVTGVKDYTKPWNNSTNPERFDFACQLDGRLIDLTLVRLGPLPADSLTGAMTRVSFRIRERWLPGEHGYRFFPAFYHHLFDTMERTPILQIVGKSPLAEAQERATNVNATPVTYTETNRTPRDNIKPRPDLIAAIPNQATQAIVSRTMARSLDELRERFEVFLRPRAEGGFGATQRDLATFFLPYLRHLTSGTKRREMYEDMSWFDFAGGRELGKGAQENLMRLPKALVAMDAKESDARTMGEVGTQLLADQFSDKGYRDGALNGPTSVAWFDDWRRYLEAQGVEFIHGILDGLDMLTDPSGEEALWPRVTCFEPRNIPLDKKGEPQTPLLLGGYIVLALPIVALKRIADDLAKENRGSCPHTDLEAVHKLDLGDPSDAEPTGEYKHFAGLQYYFAEDPLWVDGHAYFPASPWAITAISQTHRWSDRPDWQHGYRGVLSTIIAEWDTPGLLIKRPAWECTADELAREVWHQVKQGLRTDETSKLPTPLYWHLDDSFRRERTPDGRWRWKNIYPYQVQGPGGWSKRPGDLKKGYALERGLVLAGTYMKTHTRITSMEAANESGRHAVNAILRASANQAAVNEVNARFCQIWTLMEREHKDFNLWRELDDLLHEMGLPHVMDIFGVEFLAATGLRGGQGDPFNPSWWMRQIARFGAPDAWSSAVSEWTRRARGGH